MKKLFAIFAAVAMIAAFAVPAFAGVEGVDYGVVPYVATAPVVDAIMDPVYAEGFHTDSFNIIRGIDSGITAELWIVWNGDYIYAFYQVSDPDVVAPDPERSKNPWDYDNVEFFVDYSGVMYSDAWAAGDQVDTLDEAIQYRIDVSGYPSVYGKTREHGSWNAYGANASAPGAEADDQGRYADAYFKYDGNFASDIYTVEFAIPRTNTINPWGTETIEPGDVFGANVQITDFYTGSSDTTGMCFEDFDGDWSWDAHLWPNFTLGAGPVDEEPAPAPVEPDPAPVEPDPAPVEPDPAPVEPDPAPVTPAPVNPGTADVTAIFYALASISAVAGLAISKRK